MPKNRLFIRRFLNRPGHHAGAYLLARIGDTTGESGSYVDADVTLEIADCSRRIALNFPLTLRAERANSLRKARLLADALQRFATALSAEAELAAGRERELKLASRRVASPDAAGVDWMVHVRATGEFPTIEHDLDRLAEVLHDHAPALSGTLDTRCVSATMAIRTVAPEDAAVLGRSLLKAALVAMGYAVERVEAELEGEGL